MGVLALTLEERLEAAIASSQRRIEANQELLRRMNVGYYKNLSIGGTIAQEHAWGERDVFVPPQREWAVYYGSREYARMTGDPCLGHVTAPSREEALKAAAGLGGVGGEHVIEAAPGLTCATTLVKGERIRCTCQLTGMVMTGTLWLKTSDSVFLQVGPVADEFIVRLQDKYTAVERI